MPRFAQLFKDTSPPLVYSDGWQGGSSANDSLLDKYAQATYTFTKQPGATLNFRFNGTFVGIYGAKRPGYGAYTVQIDKHVFPTLNASSDVALFNQTLFNTTLSDGLHNVTLTNVGNTTIDIDYVRPYLCLSESIRITNHYCSCLSRAIVERQMSRCSLLRSKTTIQISHTSPHLHGDNPQDQEHFQGVLERECFTAQRCII